MPGSDGGCAGEKVKKVRGKAESQRSRLTVQHFPSGLPTKTGRTRLHPFFLFFLQRRWMFNNSPERRTSSLLSVLHHDLRDKPRPLYRSTVTAGSFSCDAPKDPADDIRFVRP